MDTPQERTWPALVESAAVAAIVMAMLGAFVGGCGRRTDRVGSARTKAEIDTLMLALMEYDNEFFGHPPGGRDLNDDGDLDDAGEDFGSGKPPADPQHPTVFELQLRTVCVKLSVEGGNRFVGPYYLPKTSQVVNGALVDAWGHPLRYLADGRRTTMDPATGRRPLSRVDRRMPILWSVGLDGKQDPGNNNLDDDNDGKVDEPDELKDDICSWN